MREFFTVRDRLKPLGEEKRIIACLKSWGSRHHLNVRMFDDVIQIGPTNTVVLSWHSERGEFKERSWRVFVPLDGEMRTPGHVCALAARGSDGEWHWYALHRSLVDRWLSQRLGNDFVPYLVRHHKEFWQDVGGYTVGKYDTVPAWAQWALGSFQFHFLKEEVMVQTKKPPKKKHSSPWAWFDWIKENVDLEFDL